MSKSKIQTDQVPTPHGLPEDIIISPDTCRTDRLPPRQVRTKKWPVLDAGGPPDIHIENWNLRVFGLVDKPISWNWQAFQHLPHIRVFADFHCVTRWSRLGNVWGGVRTSELRKHVEIQPTVRFVMTYGYDGGWTTNIPVEAFFSEDALFADTHDGEPLALEHGGPVRLIIPRLYAWKSAKWISAVQFMTENRPGYWEQQGYHMNGDPWTEERFS